MQPKILLVDDREDNLLSIAAILEKDGYHFTKANSGKQALKILLNEFDFALILMDVKMPVLNGFETAALIYERDRLRHIPIIFITANNYGDENVFKGYRAGAVDYIYKPINSELLRAKVAVFVDLYQKTHKLMVQEQKLMVINKNLEDEIRERKASEEKVKELNRQLLENIARLESANKDLDQFAFMASHDLQEPLRKIRTFSDRLFSRHNQLLDDEARMCVDRIQHASLRMRTLVNDILTFSKISATKAAFAESNLNDLLGEVVSDMEGLISEKQAQVMIEPLPFLSVNPGLIRPLFQNLLNNALKYSKKDVAPLIRVYAEVSPSMAYKGKKAGGRNRYCRIFIEDNGIGFDQQYAEQIFGMFKRLHLHSEFEGTGIGLALCKKIVEEHQGFISAIGKPGDGATFIVSLPFRHTTEEVQS